MKSVTLISFILAAGTAALVAAPARAQSPFGDASQRAAAGPFGGGFIELLMTGRDPGPGVMYNRPTAQRVSHQSPGGDPFADDRGQRGGPFQAEPVQRAVPAEYRRQTVAYPGPQKPGTVVIDTTNKFLYLVQEGGQAIRYGIGVGREGFVWHGTQTISQKREWPDWRPPAEMLKRRPDLPTYMAGGPENPLGARALYLGSTLYRIHGTNEPHTIGQNVSSGCIRMLNDDVVDLYGRVGVGTRVVVS